MRPIRTVLALAFALALSSAASRAQDQSTGDPVADAARKAREQKKAAPKPKKVFTDDDVKPAETSAPPAAAASDSTSPSEGAKPQKPQLAAAPNEGEKEDPNSEKAWRKRFAGLHKKISDAELELDVLERELQKSDLQYYSDPQKAMNEQFTRKEINDKTSKIEEKKKQLADLRQQLSDLEDQLRASGGDSGWAR
jgi:chromosome segregation ATPase